MRGRGGAQSLRPAPSPLRMTLAVPRPRTRPDPTPTPPGCTRCGTWPGSNRSTRPTRSSATPPSRSTTLKLRQLDSKCPDHPSSTRRRCRGHHRFPRHRCGDQRQHGHRRPLAGRHLQPAGYELFHYDVYALAGDGCLMEGTGAEAASLAGQLKLSNLGWIYDNNKITIEGSTDLAFSKDVAGRFSGLRPGHPLGGRRQRRRQPHRPFNCFQAETGKPTLIIVDSVIVDSIIGYGAPTDPGRTHRAGGHRQVLGRRCRGLLTDNYPGVLWDFQQPSARPAAEIAAWPRHRTARSPLPSWWPMPTRPC